MILIFGNHWGSEKAMIHFGKGLNTIAEKRQCCRFSFFSHQKQHPQKIVIIQVGEFYETWGIDSVFLVEHCGLNRMGKGGPRAGAPLANIQILFDGLTKAGFSVVVCEQTGDSKMDEKQDSLRRLSLPVLRYIPTVLRWIGIGHMQIFPILLLNLALSPPKQDLRLSKFIPMYERR